VTFDPISKEKRIEVLAVLAGFCFVVALVKIYKGGSIEMIKVWIEAGVGLLVIGLFIPPLAVRIAQLWLKLAHLIGAVMSRVLLTLVFFLVLLPIAGLRRALVRRNELQLKRGVDGGSYYTEEVRTYTPRDLQFPF
jgi:hypothetical protein